MAWPSAIQTPTYRLVHKEILLAFDFVASLCPYVSARRFYKLNYQQLIDIRFSCIPISLAIVFYLQLCTVLNFIPSKRHFHEQHLRQCHILPENLHLTSPCHLHVTLSRTLILELLANSRAVYGAVYRAVLLHLKLQLQWSCLLFARIRVKLHLRAFVVRTCEAQSLHGMVNCHTPSVRRPCHTDNGNLSFILLDVAYSPLLLRYFSRPLLLIPICYGCQHPALLHITLGLGMPCYHFLFTMLSIHVSDG